MLTAFVTTAAVLGYLLIGRYAAARRVPRLWVRANEIWRDDEGGLHYTFNHDPDFRYVMHSDNTRLRAHHEWLRRRYVQRHFLFTVLGWPVALLLSTGVAVDADPLIEKRRRLAAEAELARLEKQLDEAFHGGTSSDADVRSSPPLTQRLREAWNATVRRRC